MPSRRTVNSRTKHGKTSGATQIDILNHLLARKRPVPSGNIDRVLDRLVELKRVALRGASI